MARTHLVERNSPDVDLQDALRTGRGTAFTTCESAAPPHTTRLLRLERGSLQPAAITWPRWLPRESLKRCTNTGTTACRTAPPAVPYSSSCAVQPYTPAVPLAGTGSCPGPPPWRCERWSRPRRGRCLNGGQDTGAGSPSGLVHTTAMCGARDSCCTPVRRTAG